jgi:hypothetical protein
MKINEHLKEITFTDKQQQINVDFLTFDFNKLVENLKIQMPLFSAILLNKDPTKRKHFALSQNGLGNNNLIYTATVLGDLKQRKELEKESYVALLIEEPRSTSQPVQAIFYNNPQPDKIFNQGLAWQKLGELGKANAIFQKLISVKGTRMTTSARLIEIEVCLFIL